MPRQYWVAPVPPFSIVSGTALANSTTLTDISAAPQKTLPGYTLLEPGYEVEVTAEGQWSTTTGPPTLLIGLYYGGVAGVALAASTAITTTASLTAVPWQLYYRGTVRAVGTSGQIVGQGRLYFPTSLTALTVRAIPEVAASRTVTVDTTIAKTLTIGAQWGTASASNTITCDDITVRLLT